MKACLFSGAFLIAMTPLELSACSCVDAPQSPADHIEDNDIVFRGIPVGTHWVLEFEDGVQLLQSTKFRISSTLKGVSGEPSWDDLAFVFVRHERHAQGNCGFTFYNGLEYQVFATIYKNRNYTSKCHFSDLDESPPRWSWKEYRRAARKE